MTRGDYSKLSESRGLGGMRDEMLSVMGSSTLTGGMHTATRTFIPNNTVSLMKRLSGGLNSTA